MPGEIREINPESEEGEEEDDVTRQLREMAEKVEAGKVKVEEDLDKERKLTEAKKKEGKASLARGGKSLEEASNETIERKRREERERLGLDENGDIIDEGQE